VADFPLRGRVELVSAGRQDCLKSGQFKRFRTAETAILICVFSTGWQPLFG